VLRFISGGAHDTTRAQAMSTPSIRAITLHYPVRDWEGAGERLDSAVSMLEEACDYASEATGSKPWTLRLSLTPPEAGVPLGPYISELVEISDRRRILVSLGGFSPKDVRAPELKDALEAGLYAYLRADTWEDVALAARLLTSWSQPPFEHMTRVGVELLGDPGFLSPYFPISQTPRAVRVPSFSVAFMLPSALAEAFKRGGEAEAADLLLKASLKAARAITSFCERRDCAFAGADLSISPWMDDSVGSLVEEVGGCTIGDVGCILAVYRLNSLIRGVASALPSSTGFNEVMMAVGEDSLLKKRSYEKKLTLRRLMEMVPVCLAGVDMVALKSEEKELTSLLGALKAYAHSKGRPVGFRAIILPKDYGHDRVMTARFGDIPVLELG